MAVEVTGGTRDRISTGDRRVGSDSNDAGAASNRRFLDGRQSAGEGSDNDGRKILLRLRGRIPHTPGWPWRAVVVAAVTAALMTPMFVRFAREPSSVLGFSDYATHLEFASRVEFFPPNLVAPHPVFHMAVAATTWIGGQVLATSLVMFLVVMATVLVLVWFGRQSFAERPRLDVWLAVLFGAGYFVVESPAIVANALEIGNPNDWAPSDHMYLSPTDTLLVPFAVILVVLLGRTLRIAPDDRRSGSILGAATALATIAKPSMTLVLLVALPVTVLVGGVPKRQLMRSLLVWFYVPGLVIVALQTWMLQIGVDDASRAGFALRPMETVRVTGLDKVGPLLFTPLLVVVLCLWAAGRRYLAEPTVRLSLFSVAAGIGLLFVFNETGSRAHDGTFAKPAFIAFVVLHIVSWRFLAGEFQYGRTGRVRLWVIAAAGFLSVGAVAGVLAYLDGVGLFQLPPRGGI